MISMSSSRRPRAGFTLIELLVVIAIIVVLISLTTSAVMRFRVVGPRVATKNNLKSMQTKVVTQRTAVLGKARTENLTPASQTALSNSGVTNLQDPNARAVYAQLKVAQAFPRSFDQVLAVPPNALPAWPGYVTYLTVELGVVAGNTTPLPIQQAICLQMALERGPSNLAITAESLGATGSKLLDLSPNLSPAVNPLKRGQAYGCIDAFGNPLLFDPGSATATPIILSAGQDGLYGVDFVTFAVTNAIQASDNLSSLDP
jgi:prepilin-type N-terminal cleavage/methylation domain-containing protein